MSKSKKHPMIPVFLVVFFGYIGFSLAFPIFSPMFLDRSHAFFPMDTTLEIRTLLLGFTLAAYPLGQFLGLPLLGQLSDRHGRKSILWISLCVSFVAYIFSAIGIMIHSFWILILSRFVCGYAEGNFSIAQSTVADISSGHDRVKKFGIINMAASLGFVIGPIIGGKLADPDLVSWFNDDTPFWFSAILAILTILVIFWQMAETRPKNMREHTDRLHPFSGLVILHRNFCRSEIRGLYLISFLFFFGLFFFYQFYPVLLVKRYDFNSSDIADISAYVAVLLAAGQLLVVRPLAKHLAPRRATILGAFFLGPALVALTLHSLKFSIIVSLPLACIFMALATTNLQSVVSHSVSEELQGEVLGVNYSMQILGEVLTCLMGGFLAGFFIISMPLIVGGVIVFISSIALWMFTQKDLTG